MFGFSEASGNISSQRHGRKEGDSEVEEEFFCDLKGGRAQRSYCRMDKKPVPFSFLKTCRKLT